MKISDEKIRHVSHLITDSIYNDDLVDYDDEEAVVSAVKSIIFEYFHAEQNIDRFVKEKIESLKRPVPHGSREWEILYDKYFAEEMRKKGLD